MGGIIVKRILTTLVLMFFIFSTSTFAYTSIKADDTVYLNDISEFYLVDQRLKNDTNSTLVPVGAIRGVTDVYEIVYQYEVVIKDGTNLHVSIDDLFFSEPGIEREDLDDAFQFRIDKQVVEELTYSEHLFTEKVDAERVLITVTVSMNEPESVELFQQLIGGSLTFEVYFYVV